MALHLHLIDLTMVITAASPRLGPNIEPATSAQFDNPLQRHVRNGECVSLRRAHARD